MSIYLETEFFPNKEEENYINNFLDNEQVGFYYGSTTSKKYYMFSHNLMRRKEAEVAEEGVINSIYFDFFKNIFLKVCKQNNIDVNVIFRASVNRTWHHSEKYGEIHIDHNFPHKQFIWYLSDFTDAPTYIFDEEKNFAHTTCVGKNKVVIFSEKYHAQGFCSPGELRDVAVFTFN
jgi:hypothetical protein